MKFLVDAQLPVRLADFLTAAGHDAIHTSGMPQGNRTPDREIARIADEAGRAVVTKDSDFRFGHLLTRSPGRLLVVATGNITNAALMALFERSLDPLVQAFETSDFIELHNDSLVVHAREGE